MDSAEAESHTGYSLEPPPGSHSHMFTVNGVLGFWVLLFPEWFREMQSKWVGA